MIDAHAHIHRLSDFDSRSLEDIRKRYEEFLNYLEEEKDIEISGVAYVSLRDDEPINFKDIRCWRGLYVTSLDDLINVDVRKYSFLKFYETGMLLYALNKGYLDRVKRIQIHMPPVRWALQIINETIGNGYDMKLYFVHGVYHGYMYEEKDEDIEKFRNYLKTHQIYLGTSSPYSYIDIKLHGEVIRKSIERSKLRVCAETDFRAMVTPYVNDYFFSMIQPTLPFEKQMSRNSFRFFEK